jgi:hypothetical protein
MQQNVVKGAPQDISSRQDINLAGGGGLQNYAFTMPIAKELCQI